MMEKPSGIGLHTFSIGIPNFLQIYRNTIFQICFDIEPKNTLKLFSNFIDFSAIVLV